MRSRLRPTPRPRPPDGNGPDARARDPPAPRGEALRRDHRGRRARPRRPGGHLRRPPRAERRGKVNDDAPPDGTGDRRRGRARGARVPAAAGVEAGEGAVRGRAAAGQPRRHPHRRAEPARVRAPVPDPARRPPRRGRARARAGEARRPARHARRQALRRDAASPADRARPRPRPAAGAPRRADRRARPAGAPGAVGADRRAAQRGDVDPDVDALHRGGTAPRRHRADHVARRGRRLRPALGARERARGGRCARGVRRPDAARGGRVRGRGRRPPHPPHGDERRDPRRRRRERPRFPRRAAAREPGGRVRAADGRGDRLMAAATAERGRRLRRLERPAISGVLVREVINFSSYWRSATFSSTVEPTIYLLAFGFGFGSLVSRVGGYDYVQFVGTGTVATAVLFSSAFPAMFGTFVKYQFQRTYDAILAAPVDSEELVTAEALWIATRAGVYGCVPLVVAFAFGLDPSWGMLAVPFIGWISGLGWACFGIMVAGFAKSFENFNYVMSAVLTPLFLVAGTFFPVSRLPDWAQVLANLNPLHHTVELVRGAAFGFQGWEDVARLGALVVFGVLMWRIAIRAMVRKLID